MHLFIKILLYNGLNDMRCSAVPWVVTLTHACMAIGMVVACGSLGRYLNTCVHGDRNGARIKVRSSGFLPLDVVVGFLLRVVFCSAVLVRCCCCGLP